jgi:23S rRNA pseudouridine2605 synthase
VKHDPNARRVGLARAISKLGYCSRSQAAALIREGHVRLNGIIRNDPETPVRMGEDRIEIDRQPVGAQAKIYVMLNKPRGIVTTASDEKDRATVYACLDPKLPWLAPVGRLDKASEGLLLLTNDSEWASQISSPESHLKKIYHVQIDKVADAETIAALIDGVRVKDGESLRASHVKLLREGTRNSWLEITLDEGKNRQIRRMLEHLGFQVLRLVRVAIGPLQLGTLPKGSHRFLSDSEKRALDAALRRAMRNAT